MARSEAESAARRDGRGFTAQGGRKKRLPGRVMVIGGAEDKFHDRLILSRFLELAGWPDARIVVVGTASSLGDRATDLYREVFSDMGAKRVSGLRPLTREEANGDTVVEPINRATGVFLTGGNQLRLSSVVAGTSLGSALLRAHRRGAVVAGTSAGASALSTHMIAFGASGATPKHRMAQISAGLGLVEGVVIDQHFEQRTRLGRLLSIVAQSPTLLGMGLDEDTAAVIHHDQTLEVVGRGAVTLVDGSNVVTDAYNTKGHRQMMVSGAVLHSLPAGSRFDLRTRTVLPPVDAIALPGRLLPSGNPPVKVRRLVREVSGQDGASEGADGFATGRRRRPARGKAPRAELPEASE